MISLGLMYRWNTTNRRHEDFNIHFNLDTGLLGISSQASDRAGGGGKGS
jgi:hypothetical protein